MGKWKTLSKGSVTVVDKGIAVRIRIDRENMDKEEVLEFMISEFNDLCDIIDIVRK